MSTNRTTLLCRYHYDPLDCLADYTPSTEVRTQRFYLKERLASEIQGPVQRSVFQQDDQLLAQQQRQDDAVETTLLATDKQRSVLHALNVTQPHSLAYTPYGHRPAENGLLSLLGFNGERPDPVTGHYLLGNGYRAFNPVLMRFNSPDSLSPFGEGGLNAYAYCVGDPVNRTDPSGHLPFFLKGFLRPQAPRTRAATTEGARTSNVHATAASPTMRMESPASSIAQSSLGHSSQNSIYAQVPGSQATEQIFRQTRPLPDPPLHARLHTEWSDPKPEFLKGSFYDVLEHESPLSRPPRLETISEHQSPQTLEAIKKAEMIKIIGIDRYKHAQEVIRNGKDTELWLRITLRNS